MRIIIFLFSLISIFLIQLPANAQKQKILLIQFTPAGNILSGGDTVAADKLATDIKDRLFKSWSGTGKTYTKIQVSGADKVMPVIRDGALEEIRSGQNQALIAFSLELYRTEFSNLDPKKQEKLRTKFPVLFQDTFD